MKYTVLFLKWLVLGVTGLAMVLGLTLAALLTLVSILGSAIQNDASLLSLLPVAIIMAFVGFVALDCTTNLVDKWFN